jgi:autotransporter passenger strand-loop-strand repeat protein
MTTSTTVNASTTSQYTIPSGAELLVVAGGNVTGDIIQNGGALVVSGGVESNAIVSAGATEIISAGSASGDQIYGTLSNVAGATDYLTNEVIESGGKLYEVNSGIVSGTEVLNGGQLLINGNTSSGANMNTVLSGGGYVQLQTAKATVGGTLTFAGGGNILAISATTASGYGDQAVISGFGATDKIDAQTVASGKLVFGVNGAGNETVTLSGTNETFIFSGTSSYNSNTLIAVSDGVSGTYIELVSGSTTSSGTTSSATTFTVSAGQTSTGLTVSANETLTVQAGGSVTSTQIQSGGLALVSGTDASATVSLGGSATIYGAATGDQIYGSVVVSGAVTSETVENGGKLTIAIGADSGTKILAGGSETVLGSATGDQIYGTQLVSAGTAVVTNETVYNGGNLDLFLKGAVALGTTVSSGGTLQINGNATASNTTLVSGGVLELESPKTLVSGTLTFVGSGNELEITGKTSAGYGDPAIIHGFTAGNIIDITSSAFAGSALSLTEKLDSNGNSVATVTSGGTAVETFTFAGVVPVGLVSDGSGGEDVVSVLTSVTTVTTPTASGAYDEPFGNTLLVLNDGSVSAATIEGGASLIVNGGADDGATISAYAVETVSAGSASNDVIGGSAIVSGGTVSNEQVASGGALIVSGGAVDTVTLVSGGVLDLATSSATLTGSLTFSGGDNTLDTGIPDAGAGVQGVISGFSTNDKIDIAGLSTSGSITYTDGANNTEIVTVSDGQGSATFTFDDQIIYGSGTLALIDDHNGGADLVLTTTPTIQIGSLGGFTNQSVVTINGNVDIADDPEAVGSTVTIYDDSGVTQVAVGSATVGADGYWTASANLGGSGDYTLEADVTDAAGQTGSSGAILSYTVDTTAAAFTPGNLVISVYGDGSGTGNYTLDQAAPITLEQFDTSGNYIGSVELPTTTTTSSGVTENGISGEYGSASEGALQLSANGQSLTILGYGVNYQAFDTSGAAATYGNAALGQSTSLTTSTYTVVPRVVADINYSGAVDTTTALTGVYNGNNPRSVVADGTTYWISGQGKSGDTTQGVFTTTDGSNTATALNTATDTRIAEIYKNELYVSVDSTQGGANGTTGIFDYGALPTSSSAATTSPKAITSATVTLNGTNGNSVNNGLVGTIVNLSPESYFFANATTLYVADSGLPKNGVNANTDAMNIGDGGLQKWSLVNGAWTLDYTISPSNLVANSNASGVSGLYGLTGVVTGDRVQLYATSETIGELDTSYLYAITDSLSATTDSASTAILETALPDTVIRGVSFAPTACYARGTRIAAVRGGAIEEIAIEDLRVGDLALTASGAQRPIVWIGHRALKTASHPQPEDIWPVRIAAHAFAENLPRRDLWVSPGHNIAWDGVLTPACGLINGHTVTQVQTDSVEYWHVELDAHDVVLAEGLPAESYLDCGNREHFVNGGAFVVAHPDFLPSHWSETCLPLKKEGPEVVAAKTRLLRRLAEEGLAPVADAAPCVIADGERIEPVRLSEARLAFFLPEGRSGVELVSRICAPAHVRADSADTRELGLCVARLQIDGADIALHDDAAVGEGWREAETRDGAFSHRWTSGPVKLPAGARVVIVDLGGAALYWPETEALLFAQAM